MWTEEEEHSQGSLKAVKRGKASSQRTVCREHLWSATRSCTRHRAQYKIFTSSAPDTRFIFVEAEATEERPASEKTSRSAKKPLGGQLAEGRGDRGRNVTAVVLKEGCQDAQEEEKEVSER